MADANTHPFSALTQVRVYIHEVDYSNIVAVNYFPQYLRNCETALPPFRPAMSHDKGNETNLACNFEDSAVTVPFCSVTGGKLFPGTRQYQRG